MSDDLDFEMEVVESDELDELDASGTQNSDGSEDTTQDLEMEDLRSSNLREEASSEEITSDNEAPAINPNVEGWSRISLGEFATFQNGNAFSKSDWKEDGYPIIRIQNLTGEADEYNYYGGDLEHRYRVEPGDILLTWSGTIGVFKWEGPTAALNQHIFNVETREEVNDSFFHFKLEELIPQLEALSHGSTMKHVRKADLVNIDVELPPLPEQRKIASVLYTVDQAIQKTEAIIEQTKRVKRGLMQRLLTRGIGRNNRIRPPSSNNQNLYTDTRYGPISNSWNILRVSDIVEEDRPVTYGIVQPGEYTEGGVPLIRGQNYINGWDPLSNFFRVDPELHEKYSRCITRPGDVLICIAGANTGSISIVPEWVEEANLTQTTARVSVDEEVALPEYIHFALTSSIVQKQIAGWTRGSAQPGLNLSRVEKFKVPIPPKEEQEKIVARLEAVSNVITGEEDLADRLSKVKNGLKQDLLTGEVRTADKAIDVLDEVVAHG